MCERGSTCYMQMQRPYASTYKNKPLVAEAPTCHQIQRNKQTLCMCTVMKFFTHGSDGMFSMKQHLLALTGG